MLAALAFLFLLQISHAAVLFGVAPNFVFVWFAVRAAHREPFPIFCALLAALFLLSLLWTPFWMMAIAAIAVVSLLVRFSVPFLTGNHWIDAPLLAFAGTFVLSAAGHFFEFASLSWNTGIEAAYHALIALIFVALTPRKGIFAPP